MKCVNWALNCSKVFASDCNGPEVSVIAEATRALIRPAGSADPFISAAPLEGTPNGADIIFGSEEGCLRGFEAEAEIIGFLGAVVLALIFVSVFASAIFFARSFVFSTTSLAVVVFLLSGGLAAAVLLGVFLSA